MQRAVHLCQLLPGEKLLDGDLLGSFSRICDAAKAMGLEALRERTASTARRPDDEGVDEETTGSCSSRRGCDLGLTGALRLPLSAASGREASGR